MATAKKGRTSQPAAQEKGLARIQQLMEEFPEASRVLVVKTDLIREGIRPSPAARQLGRWAHPEAPWYFEYSRENAHSAEEKAEGYLLSPLVCYFSNGVVYQMMFDSRSPYEVRYEERGRYRLYRDGEPIDEVFFPPRPRWYDRKTSSGKPMPSVISARGEDNLFMAALTYCEYFKDDRGCRYCNINPSESTRGHLGLERVTAKREQDTYETFMAACQDGLVRSMGMSGGVILDPSKEADNYARIVTVVRRAEKEMGRQPVPIGISCQAMESQDLMKLKEAGTSSVSFNLEVWEPRLFELMCPGKSKYVGRERWMDRLLQAVEVFGKGRVGSSLVTGLELMPPHGFKSEDEAAASFLEGAEWQLSHGVNSGGALFRSAPGTMFEGLPSPRTEYFLRTNLARYKMSIKYDMARKASRPSGVGSSIHGDFPYLGLQGAPAAG